MKEAIKKIVDDFDALIDSESDAWDAYLDGVHEEVDELIATWRDKLASESAALLEAWNAAATGAIAELNAAIEAKTA